MVKDVRKQREYYAINNFGSLKPIFEIIKNRLVQGAYFLFTTERATGKDYILCDNGRFAHSKCYVLEPAKTYGFVVKGFNSGKIRKEKERWVAGNVYLFKYN